MEVRPLREGDERAAAALLADAFQEDPGYAFVFPDPRARAAFLGPLTRAVVRGCRPFGLCRVAADADGLLGALTLTPPGPSWPLPLSAQLTLGLEAISTAPALALSFAGAARRGLPYGRVIEGFEAGFDGWLLPLVGVRREVRGRGVGRALLADVTAEADVAVRPIRLETQTERNLGLYRAAGFELAREARPHPEGPPIWLLERRPRALEGP